MTSPADQTQAPTLEVARLLIRGGTTRLMQLWQGLQASLGLAAKETEAPSVDESTNLARERTQLALQRSYLACDRTLQAWIRTSLSMISFGFTLGKLGQAVQSAEFKGFLRREWSVDSVAYFLVVLGTVGLLAATYQHLVSLSGLRAQGLRNQPSISFIIAMFLVLLGVFAFSALVMNL